jgi:UDP-N-acetylmuramate dehydrogenase
VALVTSGEPAIVLGGGSNVVIADRGIDCLVVAISTRGIDVVPTASGAEVTAAAGEPWDAFVAHTVSLGLAGVECLSGIPGQVGATPIQNVGAYGQEVADTIVRVRAVDRESGDLVELAASECAFRYRDSAFKSRWPGRFVVLSVTFALRAGPPRVPAYRELESAIAALGRPPSLDDVRATILALRRAKGMVFDLGDPDARSAGSFFTNPLLDGAGFSRLRDAVPAEVAIPTFPAEAGITKVPAAWLIERAGFRKGHRRGRAAISSKHALAIVNTGGATADEIVGLAREIRDGVRERLGVTLHAEPVFLGFEADPLE